MKIKSDQLDGLKELLTIGAGKAASSLHEMTGLHVTLDVPRANVCSSSASGTIFGGSDLTHFAVVTMPFKGSFTGSSNLVVPKDEAAELVALISQETVGSTDFNETVRGTLTEVGNILLNGVMGSVGNVLAHHLEYGVPTVATGTAADLHNSMLRDAAAVVMAKVRFSVKGHQVAGEILLLFEVASFYGFMASLDSLPQAS
jgi:chemotaxis protein CheC